MRELVMALVLGVAIAACGKSDQGTGGGSSAVPGGGGSGAPVPDAGPEAAPPGPDAGPAPAPAPAADGVPVVAPRARAHRRHRRARLDPRLPPQRGQSGGPSRRHALRERVRAERVERLVFLRRRRDPDPGGAGDEPQRGARNQLARSGSRLDAGGTRAARLPLGPRDAAGPRNRLRGEYDRDGHQRFRRRHGVGGDESHLGRQHRFPLGRTDARARLPFRDHSLRNVRHSESYRESPPPAALMEAMGKFVETSLKDGTLVDTGGLLPSKDGVRVRLKNGKITVTDGPFTESKEVIGGWAILQTDSKAEAVRIATEFMELHRKHWPGFEGESELRPMFDPGMGP